MDEYVRLTVDERKAISGALLAATGAALDRPEDFAAGMLAFQESKVCQLRAAAKTLFNKLSIHAVQPEPNEDGADEKGTNDSI